VEIVDQDSKGIIHQIYSILFGRVSSCS